MKLSFKLLWLLPLLCFSASCRSETRSVSGQNPPASRKPAPAVDVIRAVADLGCKASLSPRALATELGAEAVQVARKRWQMRGLQHAVEVTGALAAEAPGWEVSVNMSATSRTSVSELPAKGLIPKEHNVQPELVEFQNRCPDKLIRTWARFRQDGIVDSLVWVLMRPVPALGSPHEDPVVATFDAALKHFVHHATLEGLEKSLHVSFSSVGSERWSFKFPNSGGVLTANAKDRHSVVKMLRFESEAETGLTVQDLSTRWGAWAGGLGHDTSLIFFHPQIENKKLSVVAQLESGVAGANIRVATLGVSQQQ